MEGVSETGKHVLRPRSQAERRQMSIKCAKSLTVMFGLVRSYAVSYKLTENFTTIPTYKRHVTFCNDLRCSIFVETLYNKHKI